MTESEHHQLQLERMQRLEQALDNAEAGCASTADWNTIRFECGMPRKVTFTFNKTGNNHGTYSES
jgi:hypothetical protein